MLRRFCQVDVFTTEPYRGNPVAVVIDAGELSTEQMQRVANWTNLSETTFLLPPSDPRADYLVRIFTPVAELPFAGHPTLGSCHAWLNAGGSPQQADAVVQQCQAGLIRIRSADGKLAFAAPPMVRTGQVQAALVKRIALLLGVEEQAIVDAQWVDNGPGWVAVMLESAKAVLALRPTAVDLELGVVGPYPEGSAEAFEVRAFFPKDGVTLEDPVTGSLNASVAQWLIASGRARAPYVVSQGTALGRRGRVHISVDGDGDVWVAGGTVTCITGEADI